MVVKDLKAYQRAWYKAHPHYNTKQRRKHFREIKEKAAQVRAAIHGIKQERGCLKCGEKDYRVLQFHHRNPKLKKFNLSGVLGRALTLNKRILAEIRKCDVLCANCHFREEYEKRVKTWRVLNG